MNKKFFVIVSLIFTLFFSFYLLAEPQKASDSMKDAMNTAIFTVIPSLFPFMAAAKIIIGAGFLDPLSRLVEKPLYGMFGIGGKCVGGILTGLFSGFPVGGAVICDLRKNGEISESEAETAISLSHNTGPAFPVGVVGKVFRGSVKFGFLVYVSQIISAFIAGLFLFGKKNRIKKEDVKYTTKRKAFLPLLSDAVSSSALSCVKITGFICFFGIITDMLSDMCKGILVFEAIISSFLEISSGVSAGAGLGGFAGAAVAGFSVGFSGLSALIQVSSFASDSGISMKKCFLFKLLQGSLCSGLCVLSYIIAGLNSNIYYPTALTVKRVKFPSLVIISLTLFTFSLLLKLLKTRKNKYRNKY